MTTCQTQPTYLILIMNALTNIMNTINVYTCVHTPSIFCLSDFAFDHVLNMF